MPQDWNYGRPSGQCNTSDYRQVRTFRGCKRYGLIFRYRPVPESPLLYFPSFGIHKCNFVVNLTCTGSMNLSALKDCWALTLNLYRVSFSIAPK
jgi:hypothetical protein